MSKTIVINNPSPELLKFIEDRQKEKKEVMHKICEKYRKELENDTSITQHNDLSKSKEMVDEDI